MTEGRGCDRRGFGFLPAGIPPLGSVQPASDALRLDQISLGSTYGSEHGWITHIQTYTRTDIRIKRIRSEPVNNIYLKLTAMSTHYQTWRYCVCVVKN